MTQKIIRPVLFLVIFTGFSIVDAQDLDVRFGLANKAYADGDYQQAIELYSQILNEGVESGQVFFNLGNAYYKINNLGKAVLYYEKARRYLAGDPALEQNLKLAKIRIVDKIEPVPKLFIVEWWGQFIHLLSIDTWSWLSLSLFSIAVLCIVGQLLSPRLIFRRLSWSVSLLFLLILIITLSVIYEFETTKFGVILEETVSVVSEPDKDGTEVFILHEGTKVEINRTLDNWLEISIPDGKIGWLRQSSLEII